MIRKFDHLHQTSIRRSAGNAQTRRFDLFAVFIVEFVPVTMTFIHQLIVVTLRSPSDPGISLQGYRPRRIVPPRSSISFCSGSRSITGYGVAGLISELFASVKPSHVARIFDNGHLHAEANAEERNFFLTRITDGGNFTFNAPISEAARHQNTVNAVSSSSATLSSVISSALTQRIFTSASASNPAWPSDFNDTQVGIMQSDIFTDDSNLGRLLSYFTRLTRSSHSVISGCAALQLQDD